MRVRLFLADHIFQNEMLYVFTDRMSILQCKYVSSSTEQQTSSQSDDIWTNSSLLEPKNMQAKIKY